MKVPKEIATVEAWQYNGTFASCPEWVANAIEKRIIKRQQNARLNTVIAGEQYDIVTLEGAMHISMGDYIIKGVSGELYPYKPDIFEKTYEEVR